MPWSNLGGILHVVFIGHDFRALSRDISGRYQPTPRQVVR